MAKINKDDVDRFFQYGLMPATRTIYMGEVETGIGLEESPGVDYRLADRVIKGIVALTHISDETPIIILINNPGGDEYHGLAIYDAIRATPCHVEVRILGQAMSMAAWITQAADHRIIYPNATMMVHYGNAGYQGHATDFERWAKESARLNKVMEYHFMERIREKHPKYSIKKLREILAFDTVLDAGAALELGLVDEIYKFEGDVDE